MNNYLLIGLSCALSLYTAAAYPSEPWQLVKQANGVKVYTKPISDSEFLAFKGVIEINKPQTELADVILNVSDWPIWVPDVVEARTLEQNQSLQSYYVKSDLPWPISDRDGVYRSELNLNLREGTTIIKITATPNALPYSKNTTRILKAEGYWMLTDTKSHGTLVSFQMHVEPGGSIPDWLINSYITDTPIDTLLNLKKFVAKKGL